MIPRRVRDAAVAAFRSEELYVPVLDLVSDTLIDQLSGACSPVRRLLFAGHGYAADLEIHGMTRLALCVHLKPEVPAIIELRRSDTSGRLEERHGRDLFTDVSPGLASMLIRWADSPGEPARTAWVCL